MIVCVFCVYECLVNHRIPLLHWLFTHKFVSFWWCASLRCSDAVIVLLFTVCFCSSVENLRNTHVFECVYSCIILFHANNCAYMNIWTWLRCTHRHTLTHWMVVLVRCIQYIAASTLCIQWFKLLNIKYSICSRRSLFASSRLSSPLLMRFENNFLFYFASIVSIKLTACVCLFRPSTCAFYIKSLRSVR